jgi:hypothetical protein
MPTPKAAQKKLFRKAPPLEFVEEILKGCGFLGIKDLRWFLKEEISTDTAEEWLPLLEPYYLPCKSQRFLYDFSPDTCITIFRHILRPHGYALVTQERIYKEKKHTMYQIQPLDVFQDLSGGSLEVRFD